MNHDQLDQHDHDATYQEPPCPSKGPSSCSCRLTPSDHQSPSSPFNYYQIKDLLLLKNSRIQISDLTSSSSNPKLSPLGENRYKGFHQKGGQPFVIKEQDFDRVNFCLKVVICANVSKHLKVGTFPLGQGPTPTPSF